MYLLTMNWNEETEEKKLSNPYTQRWGEPSQNTLVHSLIKTSEKHHLVLLPQQNFLFSNKDQST